MQSITHLMSCEGIYNFSHGTVEIGKNESFVAINTTENSYFLQGDEATRFIEDAKNAWENVFRNWLFPQVLERFIEDY